MIHDYPLDARACALFRLLVDLYCQTGEPVGSRALAERFHEPLSPASIRNIMARLESLGLLYSPHTSAGRLPTLSGLRFYINHLVAPEALTPQDQSSLVSRPTHASDLSERLEGAITALSSLAQCATLITAPQKHTNLKHLELLPLSPGQVLVVLVTEEGAVQNKLIRVPVSLTPEHLVQATNYLNAHLVGRTLQEARLMILNDIETRKTSLDHMADEMIHSGLAASLETLQDTLLVRGTGYLLSQIADPQKVRQLQGLFTELEERQEFLTLLDKSIDAMDVQVLMGGAGAFKTEGCVLVLSPYLNARGQPLGTIGIIGPLHLNYARVMPMLTYAARVVSRTLSEEDYDD